jgi:serine/threonine-protein kinase HipA
LPDAWGRAILCKRYNITRQEQHPVYLLELLGSGALGAMAYTREKRWEQGHVHAGLTELSELAAAAERYEREPDAPMNELMRLFMAASSPGGARPKVLVRDEVEGQWIAKLASTHDNFDVVRLEAASLAVAHAAGISIPEFRLEELGERTALLVRRFDATTEGGRNHVVSMQTLLGAQHFYHLGYADMADILRKISDVPREDLHQLYRQAVFNAMLGNTDDHLKNFAMLRGEQGWRLTPAFDLLPDVNDNRENVQHFGYHLKRPTMAA